MLSAVRRETRFSINAWWPSFDMLGLATEWTTCRRAAQRVSGLQIQRIRTEHRERSPLAQCNDV